MTDNKETMETGNERNRFQQYVNNTTLFLNHIQSKEINITKSAEYQFRMKLKTKLKELKFDEDCRSVKVNGLPRNQSSIISSNIRISISEDMLKYPEEFEALIDNTANIIVGLYNQIKDASSGWSMANVQREDALDIILSTVQAAYA